MAGKIRNPKQIPMSKEANPQNQAAAGGLTGRVLRISHLDLVLVSDFGFRICPCRAAVSSQKEVGHAQVEGRGRRFSRYALRLDGGQLLFTIDNLFDLRQKPAIDPGEFENLVDAEPGAQGMSYEKDALGIRRAQLGRDHIARKDVAVAVNFVADAPWFAIA